MIRDYNQHLFMEYVNTGVFTAEDVNRLQQGLCHQCGNDVFMEVWSEDSRAHYQCNRCQFPFSHDAQYFLPGKVDGRVFNNQHNPSNPQYQQYPQYQQQQHPQYQQYPQYGQHPHSGNVPGKENTAAILSLVLGLCGIFAWFIPLVGYPVTIVGLVFGRKALRTGQHSTMAKAGIILCIIFLVVTVINSLLGALAAVGVIDLASWF